MNKLTSVGLKDNILKKIEEYNIVRSNEPTRGPYEEHNRELDSLFKEVQQTLKMLFDSASNDHYFFFDCSIRLYDHSYPSRLQVFKETYFTSEDSDKDVEIDFLKTELEKQHEYRSNRMLDHVKYDRFVGELDEFKITKIKKMNYLKRKINKLGWTFEPEIEGFGDFVDPQPAEISFYPVPQGDEVLDYKFITMNQIVLALDGLGFFGLEKLKNLKVSQKAEILRLLTRGMNKKNLSDAISNVGIYSNSKDAKAVKDQNFVKEILYNITT